MKSWKTTTAGVLAIFVALATAAQALLDGNAATNPDWSAVGVAVMAGVGLMTARDAAVSSEQQGIK